MYAVIRNNRFTGTVYDEISDAIIAFHAAQGECICPVDVPPANVGTKENPQYADLTVAEMKIAKKAEIAAARYAAEIAGITVEGVDGIKTDRESQAMIVGAALKAMRDATYTCNWKTASGFVAIGANTILAVADAVRAHVQGCFDHEAGLMALVNDENNTVEDIQTINWETEV